MRLKERELVTVEIAPRACVKGALGSVNAGFGEKASVRASVLPDHQICRPGEGGLVSGAAVRIIIPGDVCVCEGDGVWLDGRQYTVSAAHKWRAHTELECAAVQ